VLEGDDGSKRREFDRGEVFPPDATVRPSRTGALATATTQHGCGNPTTTAERVVDAGSHRNARHDTKPRRERANHVHTFIMYARTERDFDREVQYGS